MDTVKGWRFITLHNILLKQLNNWFQHIIPWVKILKCKWIPQPDERLLNLQSYCWTVREGASHDSTAGPDTKEDGENTLAVMKVTFRRLTQHSRRGFTCAIYAAPASPIQLNARLSKQRFLLADLVVERADPIRRAPSSPIRLFRRDKWVRLDQKKHPKWIWHICASVCMNRCQSVGLHVRCVTAQWLTRFLQTREGGSSAREEGCPLMSQPCHKHRSVNTSVTLQWLMPLSATSTFLDSSSQCFRSDWFTVNLSGFAVRLTGESTHLRLEHNDIVFVREISIRSVRPACQNLQHGVQYYTNKQNSDRCTRHSVTWRLFSSATHYLLKALQLAQGGKHLVQHTGNLPIYFPSCVFMTNYIMYLQKIQSCCEVSMTIHVT